MSDGDKKLNTSSINNDSFQWVDKNGDAIVENPKNVGTYYAKLTDSAAKKLRKDNSLPQSGEESLSWLGILLSNLGLSSMFIKRKKK